MNREDAKLIGQMSDEQLKAVGRRQYIIHRLSIISFGDGDVVESGECSHGPWFKDENPFFEGHRFYRIATPKIVFNGVEMDAPIKAKDANPDVKYYGALFDGEAWHHRYQSYGAICSLENVTPVWFERLEACLTYCDTHNKMMGVGEENE